MEKLSSRKEAAKLLPSGAQAAPDRGEISKQKAVKQPGTLARADSFTAAGLSPRKQSTDKPLPQSPEPRLPSRAGATAHPMEKSLVGTEELLQLDKELAQARGKAFAVSEPFFFVATAKSNQPQNLSLEACATYYRRVVIGDRKQEKRDGHVYYVSRRDPLPKSVGTIEAIEGDVNPLAHHLLMVNDDILCSEIYDKAEHEESLAASSILFELGKGIEKNSAVAILLLSRIPKQNRSEIFGRVFVEALSEKDSAVAKACLDHGATIASLDREGRDALGELLDQGMEDLLDLACQRTALMTDYWSLIGARNDVRRLGLQTTVEVLDRHIARLRDPQGDYEP